MESVHAVCSRRDYCTFAVVVASRPIVGTRRMASHDPAQPFRSLVSGPLKKAATDIPSRQPARQDDPQSEDPDNLKAAGSWPNLQGGGTCGLRARRSLKGQPLALA
jgi:hypothetical protein